MLEGSLTTDHGVAAEERWSTLLASAQRGDSEAYRLLLGSVTPFLRAVARQRTGSGDLVDDIVQDSLLTIHRVRHTYQPGRPVKPWLAAITARRSIDAMRRRGRTGAREVHDDAAFATFADPGANREESGDAARTVAQMTSGLSEKQREAVELVKLKEMSLAEASAVSGQSVASLKVNIHRAIKRMRLIVSKDDGE